MKSKLIRCFVIAVGMAILFVFSYLSWVFLNFSPCVSDSVDESPNRWTILLDTLRDGDFWLAIGYVLPVIILVFWIITLLGALFGSAKTENKESKQDAVTPDVNQPE